MVILFELRSHHHSLTLCTVRFLEALLQWSSGIILELPHIYTALFILTLVTYYGLGQSDMEWSVTKRCVPTSCHLCGSHKHTHVEFQQLQGMTVAVCWGLQFMFAGEWSWSTPNTAGLTVTAFSLIYSCWFPPSQRRHCSCTRDYLAHTYLFLNSLQPGLHMWTENSNGVHEYKTKEQFRSVTPIS